MTERIKYIMEQEGLSPAQFADAIGIQRSRISHILLGRNNPSLDLVTKILTKFPNYDSDWLLFGEKDTNVTKQNDMQNLELSLFDNESEVELDYISKQERTPQEPLKAEKKNVEEPKEKIEEKIEESVKEKIEEKTKSVAPIKNEKKIASIILVYDDGTFKELKKEFDPCF